MEELRNRLIETVRYLSQEIGPRSLEDIQSLNLAADYIEGRFKSSGIKTTRQAFSYKDRTYYNIIAEIEGERPESRPLVIGAHYDTVAGTPGADDNASGVAGLLELARLAALEPYPVEAKFAAFCLEEPPAFRTVHMGSHAYATMLKEQGIDIIAMISLEMIGYYCEAPGCQFYPLPIFRWLYPEAGNFISLVGNLAARPFTRRLRAIMREVSSLKVESLNTVRLVPGVDFSDHRSFWRLGYPALMITDTAFYRNPYYHGPRDTPETLNFGKMSELISALDIAFRMEQVIGI